MLNTSLNTNIIPHTWKLTSIVPIPNSHENIDKRTSYRPICLHSVIAKTLETSCIPYITYQAHPTQHRYKIQHYTVTALHTLKNTIAKGFNQMAPPSRTITVTFDVSNDFYTINIRTLIRKLLQTKIPCSTIKFIANYMKGRIAFTIYINHTSAQHKFKTGVPQVDVLSPTLFNIYTADILPLGAPVHVMVYADDIAITSTHTSTSAEKTYNHTYIKFCLD